MKNLKVLSLFALVAIIGCASQQEKKNEGEVASLAAPAPSYDEKVSTLAVAQFKGPACPADAKWETQSWKQVIPLANACVKAKEWLRVEKMGNYLATRAFLTPWGPYYLSLSAESRHDYPRAVWMLELALKKDPKEGLFHYELGRIHWKLKEDHDALEHLKLASQYNPSLTDAHWVMGEMAAQRQDNSAAEEAFKKALASDPKHVPSLLGLASLKLNTKDWALAESYLTQALALSPNHGRARLALAQLQEEHLKKLPEALQNYRKLKILRAEKKLIESPMDVNFDDKIQVLEKGLAQASRETRQPTAERAQQ